MKDIPSSKWHRYHCSISISFFLILKQSSATWQIKCYYAVCKLFQILRRGACVVFFLDIGVTLCLGPKRKGDFVCRLIFMRWRVEILRNGICWLGFTSDTRATRAARHDNAPDDDDRCALCSYTTICRHHDDAYYQGLEKCLRL